MGKRCICKQFAHLPDLSIYANRSDMNELAEIPHAALRIEGIIWGVMNNGNEEDTTLYSSLGSR